MSLTNKFTISVIAFFMLYLFTGCEESVISPANQSVAFIKYYGHVSNQTGTDLKRTTSDGGYIMVGSTSSYTTEDESDIFIVKTDSLGNELWSTSLGKGSEAGTGSLSGKYVKYDEEGVSIVVLPDDLGYAVACNRTYVEYATASSTEKITDRWSKVVMYQLDISGAPTSSNGSELRTNTEFSDIVSDLKIDTTISGVPFVYVLTGHTTDVNTSKPSYSNYVAEDKFDIFTMVLDQSFVKDPSFTPVYGLNGIDKGASVQVLSDGYLVCGSSELIYNDPNNNNLPRFYSEIITVKLKKSNGTPINPEWFGSPSYELEGGHSVYDKTNQRITVTGSVTPSSSANSGHVFLLQIDENLNNQNPNPQSTSSDFNFFQPEENNNMTPHSSNYYTAESIDILPNSAGFIISATHEKQTWEHNIAILKINNNFETVSGWPYFFGYEDGQPTFGTQEKAGTVIAVTETIPGTSTSELTGYAFTGTFGSTNNMLGLVKLNTNGNFEPE
ncbi:MAG: hypothetical protein MK207_04205 [Saprospiraceae bacterium]|nr:hypothetical protein [Saprospiraceae bacterium]